MSAVVRAGARVGAVGRAEGLLLQRNALMLLTAVLLPVGAVVALRSTPELAGVIGADAGSAVVTTVTAVTLNLFVYYHLVTALVARREGLVLKRLRTGELSDGEILAGTAVPAVAIAWLQIALSAAVAAVWFEFRPPVNLVLVIAAVLLGTLVFLVLAVASTALAGTVELAQVVTAPMLFVPLTLSGLYLPLANLPTPLEYVGRVLPLTPIVDLLRLGLSGTTPDGRTVGLAASFSAAGPALLVVLAWLIVGTWAARRWFRWEPRR